MSYPTPDEVDAIQQRRAEALKKEKERVFSRDIKRASQEIMKHLKNGRTSFETNYSREVLEAISKDLEDVGWKLSLKFNLIFLGYEYTVTLERIDK